MLPELINTKSLHCEVLSPKQGKAIFDYYKNHWNYFRDYVPDRAMLKYHKENVVDTIISEEQNFYAGKSARYYLFEKGENNIIGDYFVYEIDRSLGSFKSAYKIIPNKQRKGYISEVLENIHSMMSTDSKIFSSRLLIDRLNIPSLRLAEKFDFKLIERNSTNLEFYDGLHYFDLWEKIL